MAAAAAIEAYFIMSNPFLVVAPRRRCSGIRGLGGRAGAGAAAATRVPRAAAKPARVRQRGNSARRSGVDEDWFRTFPIQPEFSNLGAAAPPCRVLSRADEVKSKIVM